jgi:DNA-binding NtrC family response regulator
VPRQFSFCADRAIRHRFSLVGPGLRAGALDYIVRLASPGLFEVSINKALKLGNLNGEVQRLARRTANTIDLEDLVAESPAIRRIYSATKGKPIKGMARDAMEMMQAYRSHGKVRELENAVLRAVVLCDRANVSGSGNFEEVAVKDAQGDAHLV